MLGSTIKWRQFNSHLESSYDCHSGGINVIELKKKNVWQWDIFL